MTYMAFVGPIVRVRVCSLVALGLAIAWLPGCAISEESIQKSKGYYQEGVASLEYDQQKSYVSFQKALKLDPNFDLNLTWPVVIIALGAILVASSFRFRDRS